MTVPFIMKASLHLMTILRDLRFPKRITPDDRFGLIQAGRQQKTLLGPNLDFVSAIFESGTKLPTNKRTKPDG